MSGVEIPVDLDRVAQLRDDVFVLAKKNFRDTQKGPPKIDECVARAKSERIVDMGSVSSPRPSKHLANPMYPWASARLRSIASARSNSAMPCTTRLV